MAIVKANSNNEGAQWWIAGSLNDLKLNNNPPFKVGDFAEIKPSDAPNAYKVYVYTGQNLVAPLGWELWGVKGGGNNNGNESFYPAIPNFGTRSEGDAGNFTASVIVDRSGYNNNIIVSTSGLPSGLTSNPFTIPSNNNNSPLVVVYDGTTPAGTYPFTINLFKAGEENPHRTINSALVIVGGGAG